MTKHSNKCFILLFFCLLVFPVHVYYCTIFESVERQIDSGFHKGYDFGHMHEMDNKICAFFSLCYLNSSVSLTLW